MTKKTENETVVTYGDLFDFLQEQLAAGECGDNLEGTKAFAERHGLYFGEIAQILEDFGGYCDCEVVLNVDAAERIDREQVIGQEGFRTPRQFAVDHDLYCNCTVDGRPVDLTEAAAAKKEGGTCVHFWVPCGRNEPYAMPDVGRAMKQMSAEDVDAEPEAEIARLDELHEQVIGHAQEAIKAISAGLELLEGETDWDSNRLRDNLCSAHLHCDDIWGS